MRSLFYIFFCFFSSSSSVFFFFNIEKGENFFSVRATRRERETERSRRPARSAKLEFYARSPVSLKRAQRSRLRITIFTFALATNVEFSFKFFTPHFCTLRSTPNCREDFLRIWKKKKKFFFLEFSFMEKSGG